MRVEEHVDGVGQRLQLSRRGAEFSQRMQAGASRADALLILMLPGPAELRSRAPAQAHAGNVPREDAVHGTGIVPGAIQNNDLKLFAGLTPQLLERDRPRTGPQDHAPALESVDLPDQCGLLRLHPEDEAAVRGRREKNATGVGRTTELPEVHQQQDPMRGKHAARDAFHSLACAILCQEPASLAFMLIDGACNELTVHSVVAPRQHAHPQRRVLGHRFLSREIRTVPIVPGRPRRLPRRDRRRPRPTERRQRQAGVMTQRLHGAVWCARAPRTSLAHLRRNQSPCVCSFAVALAVCL